MGFFQRRSAPSPLPVSLSSAACRIDDKTGKVICDNDDERRQTTQYTTTTSLTRVLSQSSLLSPMSQTHTLSTIGTTTCPHSTVPCAWSLWPLLPHSVAKQRLLNNNRNDRLVALRQMTLPPRPRDYVPGEYHFERLDKCEKKIPVVIFRCRRYRIILFLVFVYQLAVLAEFNLLPTGLLILHVGIIITIEDLQKSFSDNTN